MTKRMTPTRANAIEVFARRYNDAPPQSRLRGSVVRELASKLDISRGWAFRLVKRSAIGCREWDAAVADGLIRPVGA